MGKIGKKMRLTSRYLERQERSGVLHYVSIGRSGGLCQEPREFFSHRNKEETEAQ